MTRDLFKLGFDLRRKVPFHPIVREFEINGAKFRIGVGWGVNYKGINLGAMIEAYAGIGNEWVCANWSMVPQELLQSLTKSIEEEAEALMKGMDTFIEKECEAEINKMVTDVICETGKTKDRREIFIDAINARFLKMSKHFQTFPRPTTFTSFVISREFLVPKPAHLPKDYSWDEKVRVLAEEDSFHLLYAPLKSMDAAMEVWLTMPQIAEFGLKVYTQLAQLAEWEKSQ